MLDMGFIPDVRKIIRELPARDQRQTLLFSATLDSEVMRLASQWMPDPVQIAVEPENATVETITQLVYPIAKREKLTVLYNLLKKYETERVLVFRNRRIGCERLMGDLIGQGIACEILTGDVAQKKRLRVLEDFRSGKIKVLVATDVAGRGIHVEDIALVVNYDFPYEPDDYIHRIGRTGRAGHTGTAISFACEDESFIIPDIEELLGEELPCQQPDEELLVELPRSIRRPRTSRPPRSPRR
jgi:ATP-dependent RNA helicase RhlB